MAGISNITIIGNLGRDPETKYTPNGAMNLQFSVAVSRRHTDQSGQVKEHTDWFRVTAWGKLAETMDKLAQNGALVKGKQVYVQGRFEARDYQNNEGVTVKSLDVTANEIQLLGSRPEGEYSGGGQGSRPAGGSAEDLPGPSDMDEVPF